MLQLLCFEPSAWGSGATISMEPDCLGDISFVAPVEEKYLLADFAQELYQQRVLEIIQEQVTEFPRVDYLFLEFEGLIINRKLSRSICERYGKAEPVSFSNKVMDHCHHVLFDLDHSWSMEFLQICGQHLGSLFRRIDEMLKKQGYAGKVGVVFYAWGYESEYMPDILPDPEWWLLPWDYPARVKDDTKLYVGGNRFAVPWDANSNQTDKFSQQRIAALKENLMAWKRKGLRQCYIGNGTIAGDSTQITEELYRLCEEEQLDGYLSMGTPFCPRGLRWPGFTPDDASAAAELYSRLYHR
jgi:hypothetical protein